MDRIAEALGIALIRGVVVLVIALSPLHVSCLVEDIELHFISIDTSMSYVIMGAMVCNVYL